MSKNESLYLVPEACFHVSCDAFLLSKGFQEKHLLPNIAEKFGLGEQEEKIFFAWSEEALHVRVVFEKKEVHADPAHFENGDALELFIDTKNLKNVKATHRYIHHFCFFPECVEGVFGKEITRFRTEDRHPLCDPKLLIAKLETVKQKTYFTVTIPANCLVGYVGEEETAIGFNYRLYSKGTPPTLFMGTVDPMQAPYLWPTLRFKK